MNLKEMTLQDYLDLIARRRKVILLPLIVAWLVVIPASLLMPRVYRARAVVEMGTETAKVLQSVGQVEIPKYESVQSVRERIFSRSYILQVADRENLRRTLAGEKEGEVTDEDLMEFFKGSVSVEVNGDLMEIYVEMSDPHRAANLANAIAQVYIENTSSVRQTAASKSYEFLQQQVEYYRKKIQETEKKLQELKREHPLLTSKKETASPETTLQKLKDDLFDVEIQLESARRELERLMSARRGEGNIAERLSTLRKKLAELQTQYSDEWPEIKQLKREISELEGKAGSYSSSVSLDPISRQEKISSLQEKIETLVLRKERLRREISRWEATLRKLPEVEMEFERLTREKEIYEKTYSLLYDRLSNAMLTKAAELERLGTSAKLLDPAVPPTKPIRPRRVRMAIMATILGLGVGFGSALLLEYSDRSFRDEEEMREFLGLPVLASLPRLPEMG
jgi:polysaccharide chain length determinant protein (PEP-CTERM system associated)